MKFSFPSVAFLQISPGVENVTQHNDNKNFIPSLLKPFKVKCCTPLVLVYELTYIFPMGVLPLA